MYPILFEYNNFQISTYGFMLMMAFIVCNYLLKKYLTSINVDEKIGEDIIFYAAIGGIIGSKIFYIIEYFPTDGLSNIKGLVDIFKGIITLDLTLVTDGIQRFGSGLVFLGGLIGGALSVTYYIYKNNLQWFTVSDWVAPYIILGQGIGRLGCFFVGCCYGKPTSNNLFFTFPDGRPPTTYESFLYNHPDIFEKYVRPFYGAGDFIKVYPTQIFEFFSYLGIFYLLLLRRKNKSFDGQIFYEYLLYAGLSRFFIEFYRLNPSYIFNFTSAQIISLFMIGVSTYLLLFNFNKARSWKK